ncbi:GntR family transcriptional regulator [Paenibacillus sp. 7124]|uniref:GntR family transcriptional regulator n=1 Tax=Paenibacillus apii TaxID=1850370 RepID=A0A6M1PNP9_9BACL|nr:GntR family transcriptional regulator [Paenibacillus apii]NGM85347.1 GntR family transcriptional regulator [Paenibacillus apii]NJJ41779.1 GntR family transcriptional regulator [Paenibacillus apii]
MQYPTAWLQGVSLGESIACKLRLQIINEELKSGEVLSENRIAEEFGTSRSPVREALKELAAEGLIRLERMGAVIVGLNLENVKELYDVRYLIESFAQQRLAGTPQDTLILQLEQTIDRMKLAVKYNDYVEFAFQDFSFHEAIVVKANHTRILHLWNSIRQIVMTVILVTTEKSFAEGEQRMNWIADKHRSIVEGLRSHDAESIRKVVQAYFADSMLTLGHTLP